MRPALAIANRRLDLVQACPDRLKGRSGQGRTKFKV